jgi:hypothetical protein
MKVLVVICFCLATVTGAVAVEKTFTVARIVRVEDKVKSTVLYYQVNTPITRDDPYYEISVQMKDTIYLGVYTPRHAKDLLPAEWIPGADVRVRMNGSKMILLTPTGNELEMPIAKRTEVKPDGSAAPAATH